jgi:hypothetical protein
MSFCYAAMFSRKGTWSDTEVLRKGTERNSSFFICIM